MGERFERPESRVAQGATMRPVPALALAVLTGIVVLARHFTSNRKPAAPTDDDLESKADKVAAGWASRLERLAAGVASGVGALGLVVFAGGATQWLRFDAAGLPADQAVAAIPRNELLATGASALTVFLVAGGVVVLAAYLYDPEGKPERTVRVFAVAALAGAAYAIFLTALSASGVVAMVAVAAGLVGAGYGVTRRTGSRFLWVGTAAFLGVGLYGAVLAYAINVESPQLQPAAVLRGADDAGLTGVYIATTDKRLYLGTVTSPSGILALPCDDVTSLAIGDLRAAESDRQQETIAIRADRLLAVLTEARQTASRNRPTPAAPAPGSPATTVPGEAAEMTTPAGKSIC